MSSHRISRTNWEKGAIITDSGAVPERLKDEFWVVDNWLGSPEDDRVLGSEMVILSL